MTNIEKAKIAVEIAEYLEGMRKEINDIHLRMDLLQTLKLSEDNPIMKITEFDCEIHNEAIRMIEAQLRTLESKVAIVQGLLEEMV